LENVRGKISVLIEKFDHKPENRAVIADTNKTSVVPQSKKTTPIIVIIAQNSVCTKAIFIKRLD
jgi:hypothetical protein